MDSDEKLENLEERVSHLERELGIKLELERFRQAVDYITPDDSSVNIDNDSLDRFARVTGIDGDQLQVIITNIEQRNNQNRPAENFKYEVTETGSGLGIEIWVDRY